MWYLAAVVGDLMKPRLAIKQLGHRGLCGEYSQVESYRRVLVLLLWVLVHRLGICNRAVGKFGKLVIKYFVCSGVGLTFLFSALIMAATTALFVLGSISEILVCDPLADPTHSEVFNAAAELYNLNNHYPPGQAPSITEIIR